MKKFYNSKLAIFAVAFLVIFSACALTITKITVKEKVAPGETFDMTVEFKNNQMQDGTYNLYCAVRVPQDWTVASVTFNDPTIADGVKAYDLSTCENYATYVDYCYPCETGYKWVGFSTPEATHLTGESGKTGKITFTAGQTTGEYRIDFVGGGSENIAPADIVVGGKVNLDRLFGNKTGQTPGTPNDNNVQDGAWGPSEYIIDFGTIPAEEIAKNNERLKNVTATIGGKTMPIKLEIDELYTTPTKVTVTTDLSGIENAEVSDNAIDITTAGGYIYVKAQQGIVKVYNAAGALVNKSSINGVTAICAQKGLNIVEVSADGVNYTKKMIVK